MLPTLSQSRSSWKPLSFSNEDRRKAASEPKHFNQKQTAPPKTCNCLIPGASPRATKSTPLWGWSWIVFLKSCFSLRWSALLEKFTPYDNRMNHYIYSPHLLIYIYGTALSSAMCALRHFQTKPAGAQQPPKAVAGKCTLDCLEM